MTLKRRCIIIILTLLFTAMLRAEVIAKHKIGSFMLKNIAGSPWIFNLDEEGNTTLAHNSAGMGVFYLYKNVADSQKKIKEIIDVFKKQNQNVSTSEPVISETTFGQKKFTKAVLKGNEQSAYLYILSNKTDILSVDVLLDLSSPEVITQLETFLATIEVETPSPPATPVAAAAPAAANDPADPNTANTESQTGNQSPAATAPQPASNPQPATEPAAVSPPNDPKLKNKELFLLPIYSSDYKIKIGMEYGAVKEILKDKVYTELTREKIKALILYKFKLLKSKVVIKEKYAEAVSKVSSLKVIEAAYSDKKLMLFFYNDILYSIKVREEGVVPADYDIEMGKLARALSGSALGRVRKLEYGFTFKLKKDDGIVIEYSSYSFDTSAEMTLYLKKYVSTVEREIRKTMRTMSSEN